MGLEIISTLTVTLVDLYRKCPVTCKKSKQLLIMFKVFPVWKTLTYNETCYEDTGEVLDGIEDSSSTLIGEVGMLELSCGPTWASGKELLASVVFRVSKNSNILKYLIRHQPGNRSQLRDDFDLRYASLARSEVYGDQLRRYLSQKNDLA